MIYVSNLNPNAALAFIDARVNDVNYRGSVSSQHNRYDMDEIYKMLICLNRYAPHGQLLRIRDTDTKKRPGNTPDEYDYARFCEDVNATVGKGTQDSIRKNIFVDLIISLRFLFPSETLDSISAIPVLASFKNSAALGSFAYAKAVIPPIPAVATPNFKVSFVDSVNCSAKTFALPCISNLSLVKI